MASTTWTPQQKALAKRIKKDVCKRLGGYRLEHVLGVAKTAKRLARLYGIDDFEAYVAGLLHDWDKALSNDELLEKCLQYNISLPDDPNRVMALLHAWTAAFSLLEDYPELDDAVFRAIAHHTTGAAKMHDLDMVLYIADAIEPSRKNQPWLDETRPLVGKVALEELYIRCYVATIEHLVANRRYIYPRAIEIYNTLIDLEMKTQPVKFKKKADKSDQKKAGTGKTKKPKIADAKKKLKDRKKR